jgi:hypothetical protein
MSNHEVELAFSNMPFLGMEYVKILKFQYSGVVENFKLNVLIIIILKK